MKPKRSRLDKAVARVWANYRSTCRSRSTTPYPDVKRLIREMMGSSCRYCYKTLTGSIASVDHRTPLSRGGSELIANMDLVCKTCNRRKGTLIMGEYASLLDLMAMWPPEARKYVLSKLSSAPAWYGRK